LEKEGDLNISRHQWLPHKRVDVNKYIPKHRRMKTEVKHPKFTHNFDEFKETRSIVLKGDTYHLEEVAKREREQLNSFEASNSFEAY
jgi:hypothetical protein